MRKTLIRLLLALAVVLGGIALAQKPVENVNPNKHPNLAAAQRLTEMAYTKVVAAESANEYDLGGHAAKAKELLDQANQQLKMAAQVSNANHR